MKQAVLLFACVCAFIPSLSQASSDPGFEKPAMSETAYEYFPAPSATTWSFGSGYLPGDGAGVSGAKSGFTEGNPLFSQVAFIQNHGTLERSVTLDPGDYEVTFFA
jgi:hypothetical protein